MKRMKSLKSRVFEDRTCGIVVRIDENDRAHVSWRDGSSEAQETNRSCWVDAQLLTIGRWVPMSGDDPTICVVCRATAIVVAAAIKVDVLEALEGLP